ncbi:MAG: Gfo/Idh/MocA family oxidoreductase [Clostridia bacterium]|nr:Gfo/Idh/MocA family oxidoreductase [Clostridia bacterium]
MKIGLLGFGSMGKTHTYCAANLRYFFDTDIDVRITRVCTRNIENARLASKRYGIDSYTDNEDDVIYDPEIDAVDICTPNIYHYETVKKALLAGKHVYCEKPLAVTYEQAKELSDLAKGKKLKAMVVFNNRFLSAVMRAKEIVENGDIGTILSFEGKYLHSSATDVNKNAGWKQNSDICGGGVLFDLGSHIIDLIYYLCGEFESVIGKGQIAYPLRKGMNGESWVTNADEAFYIIAGLKCGAVGTIEVSKITVGANDDFLFRINGEKGAIRFSLMDPNFLEFYSNDRVGGDLGGERGFTKIECVNRYPSPGGVFPGIKAPVGWLRGHIGSFFSFCDGVINNKPLSPSFDDGAYVQRIMECAYLSDRQGKEIKI